MRVLFAGASGYGNAGDDVYRRLFAHYLPDVRCAFDSPYPNPDMMRAADAVVIGGGGLIYRQPEAHFAYMREYMEYARRLSLPLFFLSCGVQTNRWPKDLAAVADELEAWRPYLEYARVVSVRSPTCADAVRAVAPSARVQCAPDLAYLTEPAPYRLIPEGREVVIVHRAAVAHADFGVVWNRLVREAVPPILVAMAAEDVSTGDGLRRELTPHANLVTRAYLTAEEVAGICRDATRVWTSRYHGFVLAHAAGQRDIRPIARDYKLAVEVPPEDRFAARQHFEVIRAELGLPVIDAIRQLPPEQGS